MAKHKQRRRPAAGIEVVYDDERYSAIVLFASHTPDPVLRVYAKPHHDHLFSALSEGLFFECKRCQHEHLLRWEAYARKSQAEEPPYHVLCIQANEQIAGIWLARPDEYTPQAHRIYTIASDHLPLIATIAAYLTNRQS